MKKQRLWMAPAVLIAMTTWAGRANAEDDKTTCVRSYTDAQTLRSQHKLIAARSQLRSCSRAQCAPFMSGGIVKDCTDWLAQTEAAIPSVVLSVVDSSGNEVMAVNAWIDGTQVATKLDGRGMDIDPGSHIFTFQGATVPKTERTTLVLEGKKDQLVRVTLGGAPASEGKTPPAAAPPATGRVRVRATCGADGKIIAGSGGLVVEEILDSHDLALKPQSEMTASLKYDEASHERVMKDPEWVDFDLTPGAHRVRIRGRRCIGVEERLTIEAGKTLELSPKLEVENVPLVNVKFSRPEFASTADKFELRDGDGKIVCTDFPCTAKVPTKDNGFGVIWAKAGGSKMVTAKLADPSPSSIEARLARREAFSPTGLFIGAGGVALAAVGAFFLAFDLGGWDCSYDGATGGTPIKTTDKGRKCYGTPQNSGNNLPFTGAKSQDLNFTGWAFGAAPIAIGGATLITGLVLTVLNVGGKETMTIDYGGASRTSGKIQIVPTLQGIGGTF